MAIKRYWTEDDRATLDLMTQQGYGVPDIAKKLKCDPMRIYNHTKGGKLVALRQQVGARVHTLESVRRLFGVHKSAPYYWIEYGWLAPRRNRAYAVRFGHTPKRPRYLVTDAALLDFIERRDTWVAWTPNRITDPDWRRHAEEVRRSVGGHWLTTKDVAARFGYGVKTVPEWVRRGAMVGVAIVKYGSNLFFWSEDIARWAPPLERRAA